MKTRIISGVCIGFIIVPVLLLGGWVLWGFLLAISLIAFLELTGAMGVRKKGMILTMPELAGLLAIVALYLALKFVGSLSVYIVTAMLLLTALFFIYVFSFPRIHSREVMTVFFSFLYAPCMLSFLFLIWMLPYGDRAVWLPFVAWISDTSAYFGGRLFGKHKLTPVLSPKKTVEGAVSGVAGSLIVGVIYGAVVGHLMGDYQLILLFAIITTVGSVVAQLGDLVASGIKRDHGIKDFGKCIPGHGGIMDRFDSVVMITPMIYFLFVFLLRVMAK